MRHSFATHLIEANTPVHVVQQLLGHNSVRTAVGYLHISRQAVAQIHSPLDAMSWAAASAPAL